MKTLLWISLVALPAFAATMNCSYVMSTATTTTALREISSEVGPGKPSELVIENADYPGVKLTARYSERLKTVDTEISDSRIGIKATGLDFFNPDVREAGSAVSYKKQDGEYYMLSCAIH